MYAGRVSTGIALPCLPVRGLIGVSVLPTSLSTQSRLRSHDGVTCWGSPPVAKWSMTLYVRGSITSTVLLWLFGTYTRGGSRRTAALRLPARSAA